MITDQEVSYSFNDRVTVGELFDLLEKMMKFEGDRFPARNVFHFDLRDPSKEQESLENTISVTARCLNGNLVGYLRILTDNAYIYYILDVMVEPENRGRNIGRRLVEMAVEKAKLNGFIKIFLTAMPGTESFYREFGFNEGMSPVLTIRGEDYVND
jgi:GNAT superfamily N-acetyltransferase